MRPQDGYRRGVCPVAAESAARRTCQTGAAGARTWFSWGVAESDERSGEKRGSNRPNQGAARFVPSVQVIGVTFVLLILAGYFAWMIVEMGGHAVPKAWPMVGVLVAAVAGGIAATLGMAIGRRSNDSDRD